jgi:hypothetical protein
MFCPFINIRATEFRKQGYKMASYIKGQNE